jgi:hypothetical protein
VPKRTEYVWMHEFGVLAELLNLGAHVSLVRYSYRGTVYQVLVDNDEFDYREEDSDDED